MILEVGPWTRTISITWELGEKISQASQQHTESKHHNLGPMGFFLRPPCNSTMVKLKGINLEYNQR